MGNIITVTLCKELKDAPNWPIHTNAHSHYHEEKDSALKSHPDWKLLMYEVRKPDTLIAAEANKTDKAAYTSEISIMFSVEQEQRQIHE